MAREVFAGEPKVVVESFGGLLVDFARQQGAHVIVRGLRAISDFEYEFQMALMNRRMAPEFETVFMMPAESYTYISSRLIREVFALGGPIAGLVPEIVEPACAGRARRAGRAPERTVPRRSVMGVSRVRARHIGVADDGAERAGARPARAGGIGRAPRDRRTAEPGAAVGDRHGGRGAGGREDQVHADHGSPVVQEGRRQVHRGQLRADREPEERDRLRGREAGDLQRAVGDSRSRRRGHPARAVLGELPRDGEDVPGGPGRRDPDGRAASCRRSTRLRRP